MATPLPSLRTTRPLITSFKPHTPSRRQGQLTISSMEPENGRRSATSKSAPVLLMLQILPEPRRSSLPNNLYSTVKASGKRSRARPSDNSLNGYARVATDIYSPRGNRREKWIDLYTIHCGGGQ